MGVAFLTDYAGHSGLLALCATFGLGPWHWFAALRLIISAVGAESGENVLRGCPQSWVKFKEKKLICHTGL